tara:strand:+ start:83 stop:388 length:306 start_codon:yes stop_codon:yes gene_type:complete
MNTTGKGGFKDNPHNINKDGKPIGTPSIPSILKRLTSEPSKYDPNHLKTALEMICETAIDKAIGGDKSARDWVSDRMEGKALERFKDETSEPIKVFDRCDG